MSDTIHTYDPGDPRLTAYALGELEEAERAEVEALLAESAEARRAVAEAKELAALLASELAGDGDDGLTVGQRAAIESELRTKRSAPRRWWRRPMPLVGAAVLLVAVSLAGFQVYLDRTAPHAEAVAFNYQVFGEAPRSQRPAPGRAATRQLTAEERQLLESVGYGGGIQAQVEHELTPRTASEESLPYNTESYDRITDNAFVRTSIDPRSTFSIDVDTASYANVRRKLLAGQLPEPDAVRIEELVNYFPYDYAPPTGPEPFSVHVDVASAPWKPEHRLVRIGLKGREVSFAERRASNLVFLVDVSGSMQAPNKLPLLQQALGLLVQNLDPSDRVAIVVYAGSSGLVLPSTPCSDAPAILEALGRLQAGGSTNGGAGIDLAYRTALANLAPGGNNRVVLATDGDFNVGTTDKGQLVHLVSDYAKKGVFLTVLGFGGGNLKDDLLEQISGEGDGNYSYVDSVLEARKVLVEQMGGTLHTIAKDVKIQVEFNPAEAAAWRLIGYENRVLAHQDFNDDTKDAGEIGSGHTVTALYEVVPAGGPVDLPDVDPLRYGEPTQPSADAFSGELLHVKLRYKRPGSETSELIEQPVRDTGASIAGAGEDFRFAAAVASFGMLLRGSEHRGQATWVDTLRLAREGLGADRGGYRQEFVQLVQRATILAREPVERDEALRAVESLGYAGDD